MFHPAQLAHLEKVFPLVPVVPDATLAVIQHNAGIQAVLSYIRQISKDKPYDTNKRGLQHESS